MRAITWCASCSSARTPSRSTTTTTSGSSRAGAWRARAGSMGSPAASPPPLPPDFKERVRAQFEGRASAYDLDNSYHPPLAARTVELAALRAGERVLDIATGTGLVALGAARAVGAAGRVVGVDLSDAMIHQAALKAREQGLQNVIFLAADVEECEHEEGSWDAVLCSSALPFLADIPAALAAWCGWLADGSGRLVFNCPKVGGWVGGGCACGGGGGSIER